MGSGIVYVVHNNWIQNPDAKEGDKTYKIGITAGSVEDRYYGLDLKMPSKFICDFAYKFDSEQYRKVETTLHNLLNKQNVGGEWFDLNETALKGIRSTCEGHGGILDTDNINEKIAGEDADESVRPREKWIKESKWTVEIADYLSDLIFRKDVFKIKYTLHYISFVPISSNKRCFFLPGREKDASLFLINRDELRKILDKNNIHYKESEENEAWLIAKIYDKQFVEQHKDVFIKIAKFLKDFK
jgi:hypothetical protein